MIGKAASLILKMAYVWPDTLSRLNAVRSASFKELKALRDDLFFANHVVIRFDNEVVRDGTKTRDVVNRIGNIKSGLAGEVYAIKSTSIRDRVASQNIVPSFNRDRLNSNYAPYGNH